MKKYILILFLLFARCIPAISQAADSLKIDSLKKQLLYLKDSNKVDCLNLLAVIISSQGGPLWMSWIKQADTMYYYASIAYREANKIDYKRGMAVSLKNLATSANQRGIDLRKNKQDDASNGEEELRYLSQALPLAEQLQDDKTLGDIYVLWGDLVYIKSKSTDAVGRAEYFKKSIDHFHKAGDENQEGEMCTYVGESYTARGYYEEALGYCSRGLALNKKRLLTAITKTEKEYSDFLYQQSLVDMANLYKVAGDYQTALVYLNQGHKFGISRNTGWDMGLEKAEIFRLLQQYDSSFYYLNRLRKNDPENPNIKLDIGATFLLTNQIDSALGYLKPALAYFRKRYYSGLNFGNEILISSLLYMGRACVNKSQYSEAMSYTKEGITMAVFLGIRPRIMQGYELLSRIHHNLGNNDSAYQYLLKYSLLKDSIQNRQFLFRLTSYQKAAEDEKKQSQILLLNKDNKIKDQQLKQESLIRNFLIAGLLALVIAGIFIYRTVALKRKNEKLQREQLENTMKMQQLENEKKQAAFQQQAAELEMQALRAQMNPHFIFNCLSSINRIILKNESQAASDYLTRFSRLIRMVLINSQKAMIALEDELQMLRLYLDMERLRFKNSFDYSIIFTNTIDEGAVFIPPLILQPFCENAIWHGLMQKEGQGHLNIELSMQDNILHCIISDDGIGREKAAALKSKSAEKEKSMGLAITAQRLALLNQNKNVQTFYTIEDNRDADNHIAGTKVILKIAYKEFLEEPV